MEQDERVHREDGRDHDREAGEIPLHDVRPSLGGGRETHAPEAGVPARVHQDERHEHSREEHLHDGRDLKQEGEDEHAPEGSSAASLRAVSEDSRAKIQKLLVTGDNRLKQGVSAEKVRETYEEALALAREAGLEESVRPLVEVRLADLERLAPGSPRSAPPAA
jgi:hypothetical protein